MQRQPLAKSYLHLSSVLSEMLGAILVGIIGGFGAAGFTRSLNWATKTQAQNGWLLFLLPIAGVVNFACFRWLGADAKLGLSSIFAKVQGENGSRVAFLMAPFVFISATFSHLFGASAGREGAGIQIVAGLTSPLSRVLRLTPKQASNLLVCAISAGLAALFGLNIAAAVFALEVTWSRRSKGQQQGPLLAEQQGPPLAEQQGPLLAEQQGLLLAEQQMQARSRLHSWAQLWSFLLALVSAFFGSKVARSLGTTFAHRAFPNLDLGVKQWVVLAALGVFAGINARGFVWLTCFIKVRAAKLSEPQALFLGGTLIVGLTLLLGTRSYNGLSTALLDAALVGGSVPALAFVYKMVLTSITVGTGFRGGEFVPLLVIGATTGAAFALALSHAGKAANGFNVQSSVAAGLCLFACLGAGANAPLFALIASVETFHLHNPVPIVAFGLVVLVARYVSGEASIYGPKTTSSRDASLK